MTWLIVGGAGYVGGHTVARLHAAGRPVVVLDDLSAGLAERVPDGVPLVRASMHDTAAVAQAMIEHGVTGVMQFAALKSVPESVSEPVRYYRENVGGLVSLLSAMTSVGVGRIVYSSSAAVYSSGPVAALPRWIARRSRYRSSTSASAMARWAARRSSAVAAW